MPRLNKVLQELNIGFDTAKDYLRETFGISISSVNDKITEIDRGIESLMRSDVSESTKRTQKYQKSKQMHDLIVVREVPLVSPKVTVTL